MFIVHEQRVERQNYVDEVMLHIGMASAAAYIFTFTPGKAYKIALPPQKESYQADSFSVAQNDHDYQQAAQLPTACHLKPFRFLHILSFVTASSAQARPLMLPFVAARIDSRPMQPCLHLLQTTS